MTTTAAQATHSTVTAEAEAPTMQEFHAAFGQWPSWCVSTGYTARFFADETTARAAMTKKSKLYRNGRKAMGRGFLMSAGSHVKSALARSTGTRVSVWRAVDWSPPCIVGNGPLRAAALGEPKGIRR